jgi:hypothetical protein
LIPLYLIGLRLIRLRLISFPGGLRMKIDARLKQAYNGYGKKKIV